MTEDQIELRMERFVDHLDACFMARQIDRETYDKALKDLHAWAEEKYVEALRNKFLAHLIKGECT